MSGTHISDRYRLEPTYTTIILDIDPGKPIQYLIKSHSAQTLHLYLRHILDR